MIEILKSIENNKVITKENVESKNNEEVLEKNLIKQKQYLTKKISEIKKNIHKSTGIRTTLPDSFIPVTTNSSKNCKNDMDDEDLEKKLEKVREKEKNETQILLNKYLNIMEQNKKEIIKGNEYFNNKINIIYSEKIKKYEEEIIRVFNLIQKIIKIYYKSFSKTCSLYLMKNDCDKLLKEELNNINALNFPLLFKILKNNDDYRPKKKYKKISKNIINLINLGSNDDDDNNNNKELINDLNNKDNNYYSIEELSSKKTSLF